MTDHAVVVDGLEKSFGDFRALDGVSFTAPAGSVLAVLGPNGAGKTTTVSILATLKQPDAGRAAVAGFDVVTQAAQVRRVLMLTGQYAALDEVLTGRENLTLFGRLLGLSRSESVARARELLAQFDLEESADRRVGEYSGGMRRRLDIACGLVVRPEVVFLDEPTTGLDPRSRQDVWSLVASLKQEGITTLLTTQYLEEADQLADRIAVIDRGRVVAEGTSDDLKAEVGQSSLQLTVADQELDRARSLVSAFLGVDVAASPEAGRLTAPMTDPSLTPEVLIRLRDDGISVTELNVQKPSLDEVFFALTGHGADDENRSVA